MTDLQTSFQLYQNKENVVNKIEQNKSVPISSDTFFCAVHDLLSEEVCEYGWILGVSVSEKKGRALLK